MIEKYIPYIIISFYIIYFAQAYLSIAAVLSTVCALGAVAICAFYLIKTFLLKESKPLIINSLVLIIISYLYCFILTKDTGIAINMMKDLALANFVIFPTFYLTKKGKINESFFKWLFIILLVFFTYDYFGNKEKILLEKISSSENVVNNTGYRFLCIIPLVFFFKRNYLRIIFLGIISIFIINSSKRGAILTLLVSLVICFIPLYKDLKQSKYKFWRILLLFIVIVTGFYYLIDIMLQNEYLLTRFTAMSEGDSSGRDLLLQDCWNGFWDNGNTLNYLFGYGLGSTVQFAGNFAHNDWIEILVNNGLIGVFLLLLFYLGFIVTYHKYKNTQYNYILLVTFFILFIRTLFSMSFTSATSYPLMMLIGYVIALEPIESIEPQEPIEPHDIK